MQDLAHDCDDGLHLFLTARDELREEEPCSAIVPNRGQRGHVQDRPQVRIAGLADPDFEYEFQMAGMNQQLNDNIETVFLMADVSLQPIASKLVKEIARFGGSIDKFVPPRVVDDVRRHLNGGSR